MKATHRAMYSFWVISGWTHMNKLMYTYAHKHPPKTHTDMEKHSLVYFRTLCHVRYRALIFQCSHKTFCTLLRNFAFCPISYDFHLQFCVCSQKCYIWAWNIKELLTFWFSPKHLPSYQKDSVETLIYYMLVKKNNMQNEIWETWNKISNHNRH